MAPGNKFRKIAVLCRRLPNPRRSSGELRFFHILNILRSLCEELVLFRERDDNLDLYPSSIPLHLRRLKQEIKGADLAFLEFWYMDRYIPVLQNEDVPVVLDSVDVEYSRRERAASLSGKVRKDFNKNRAREIGAYRASDQVWAVSQEDALLIRKANSEIAVIGNIHPTPGPGMEFEQRRGVIFVGSFKHQPNVDGLRWYMREIFPQVSDLPHRIIGHDAPADLRNIPGYIGGVRDSSAHVKRARVSIAPLRYGAGLKGKVGEAFACGTPVITTEIGSEGYPVVNNQDLWISSDPLGFAEGIRSIYKERKLWDRLSTQGLKLASNYEPKKAKQRITAALQQAVNGIPSR